MFEVKTQFNGCTSYIHTCHAYRSDGYLHSDGSETRVCEFFETPADAQRVLDKYYPKPKHVWKHGDVFSFECNIDKGVMIFLCSYPNEPASVFYIDKIIKAYKSTEYYLKNAEFMFNIMEKLQCHQHQQ